MTALDIATARFARRFASPGARPTREAPSPIQRRKATVATVTAAGLVTLTVGGSTLAGEYQVADTYTPIVGDTVFVENVDGGAIVRGAIGPSSWQTATLLAGAVNWAGRAQTTAYRAIGSQRVLIRGIVTLGAAGSGNPLFVLATAYRPPYDQQFPCLHWTGAAFAIGLVQVFVNGNVTPTATNSQFCYLDGIAFSLV